jgi:hypothetical protein
MDVLRRRAQDGADGFCAVWDHWLLDTISSWQRQNEDSYRIVMGDERAPSPPTRQAADEATTPASSAEAPPPSLAADADADGLPPRKRPRSEAALGVNGASIPQPTVAAYLNGLHQQAHIATA